MSHWGGDSDNTYTEGDFETDSEQDFIDTDTERLGDSDSEVLEFDIDATSGDETETDEEIQPPGIPGEARPLRRTCTLVQGLCTTGLQSGGVEILGHANSPSADKCGSADPSKRSSSGQHSKY